MIRKVVLVVLVVVAVAVIKVSYCIPIVFMETVNINAQGFVFLFHVGCLPLTSSPNLISDGDVIARFYGYLNSITQFWSGQERVPKINRH